MARMISGKSYECYVVAVQKETVMLEIDFGEEEIGRKRLHLESSNIIPKAKRKYELVWTRGERVHTVYTEIEKKFELREWRNKTIDVIKEDDVYVLNDKIIYIKEEEIHEDSDKIEEGEKHKGVVIANKLLILSSLKINNLKSKGFSDKELDLIIWYGNKTTTTENSIDEKIIDALMEGEEEEKYISLLISMLLKHKEFSDMIDEDKEYRKMNFHKKDKRKEDKELIYMLSQEIWKYILSRKYVRVKTTSYRQAEDAYEEEREFTQKIRLDGKFDSVGYRTIKKMNTLPMISKPRKFDKKGRGGIGNNFKLVKTGGESTQPENIRNICEAFQEQPFELDKGYSRKIMFEAKMEAIKEKYIKDNVGRSGKRLEKEAKKLSKKITTDNYNNIVEVENIIGLRGKFYLKTNYDYRGRLYTSAYEFSYQGEEYSKSIVVPSIENFPSKLENRESAILMAKIDIANNLDKDKLTFDERIKWVDDNWKMIPQIVEKGKSTKYKIQQIKRMYKAIKMFEKGEQTNVMMHLDATNQALQLYAISTRDKVLGKITNLTSSEKREDAYEDFATELNKIFGKGFFSRKMVKKPMMTRTYGKMNAHLVALVEKYGRTVESSLERLEEEKGMNEEEYSEQYYGAEREIIGETAKTMDKIIELHKELNQEKYYWEMPDGFKVTNRVKRKIKGKPKVYHPIEGKTMVRETNTEIHMFRKSIESRALAPNIIHSIDAYILRNIKSRFMQKGKFLITIHDSYGVHPSEAKMLMDIYREEMVRVMEDEVLQDIMEQIWNNAGREGGLPKEFTIDNNGELTKGDIMSSRYALC